MVPPPNEAMAVWPKFPANNICLRMGTVGPEEEATEPQVAESTEQPTAQAAESETREEPEGEKPAEEEEQKSVTLAKSEERGEEASQFLCGCLNICS